MEIFTLKDMTFTYAGAAAPALSGVTLSVEAGEMITLCGRSGSGKSTLLRNLKPALAPYGRLGGTLEFCGMPLAELSAEEQALRIGYVMQNPDNQVVTDKVWHELAFGLESLGTDTETIRLRVAEMAGYFGIQNWFHKDVSELSGGQKQLLNLASVMVMQPDVLILDEPTSQLDPIAAGEFLETVRKINRELGTTVIMTEHRLGTLLPISDRVVALECGRVIVDDIPANAGAVLAAEGHSMFMAMPAPLQAYARLYDQGIGRELECPLTVREGRRWLTDLLAGKAVVETALPESKTPGGETAVEMKGVWFRYGRDDDDVIRDMSLSIHKGELFCMVGGNGVGKTTALNIIGGLAKPYRGRVSAFGRAGMVPQNPQSVFVEKTLGRDLAEMLDESRLPRAEKEERVAQAAAALELGELLDMHPYDLSGGEQQRAALAKVLLLEPEILIMDEPTKGLDPALKEKLAEILRSLCSRGVTVIMASHDIEFCCRYADRCAMIFDGKVTACETPRRFFAGNSFYTTAANRMSRHVFRNAVTVDDLVELAKVNLAGAEPRGPEAPGAAKPPGNTVDAEAAKDQGEAKSPKAQGEPTAPCKSCGLLADDSHETAGRHGTERSDDDGAGAERDGNRRLRNRRRLLAVDLATIALAAVTVLAGMYLFDDKKYFIVSLLLVIYSMVPFFVRFEHRSPKAREIVILAVMITAGVVGRAAFFILPNFKPLAAVVIISGVALGRQAGFLVGAMSAFVSNFLFGQGPWTAWQMLALAIIGYLAGAIFYRYGERIKVLPLAVFGGLATFFIYGAITDMWTILMMTSEPSLEVALMVYGAAVPFNAIHAAATVIFLLLLAKPVAGKIGRVRAKHGR